MAVFEIAIFLCFFGLFDLFRRPVLPPEFVILLLGPALLLSLLLLLPPFALLELEFKVDGSR
jgi:hypothetical protein